MSRKKTSKLWNYFELDPGDASVAVCQVDDCNRRISRGKAGSKGGNLGNGSMKPHLRTVHPETFKELEKTEAEAIAAKVATIQDLTDETVCGTKSLYSARTKATRAELLTKMLPDGDWATVKKWGIEEDPAKKHHRGIVAMMTLNLVPFSFVSNAGFLYYVSETSPKYEVASESFYRGIIDKIYVKGVATVKAMLQEDEPQYIAAALDGWSQHHHGYIGLHIVYITRDWLRQQVTLCCHPYDERHKSVNLARWLMDELKRWGIADLVGKITTDTAKNMEAMFKVAGMDLYTWGRCVNHILQLVIKSLHDELLSTVTVEELCAALRALCTFANQSTNYAVDLRKAQETPDSPVGLMLVQDVPTRWNSTQAMLKRALLMKDAIQTVQDMEEWDNKLPVKLQEKDFSLMGKVVLVLEDFFDATERLSFASASISEVVPVVTTLRTKLADTTTNCEGIKGWKKKLLASLTVRLGWMESDEDYAIATLLDPRFKQLLFMNPNNAQEAKIKLVDHIKAELPLELPMDADYENNTVVQDNSGDFFQAMKRIKLQKEQEVGTVRVQETVEKVVESYLALPTEEHKCLRFWKQYEQAAGDCQIKKALLTTVKRYLTPPPTSTDVERLFSRAGAALPNHRAGTLPERVDRVLFIRENILSLNFALDWE